MMSRLLMLLILYFTLSPTHSQPVPSFLSPVSFDQEKLESWLSYFGTCGTNPPEVPVPLENVQDGRSFVKNMNDDSRKNFLTAPFQTKIPTPIKLAFENDESCNVTRVQILGQSKTCTKFAVNVTDTERTLFFDARKPTKDYFVSYYMNRTGFPYHPRSKSDIDFNLNNQIEYSYARAVTLSVNADQQKMQTFFKGLGENEKDNEEHTSERITDVPFYFVNAVFLGASEDVPDFRSHELPDGKRYPMEIYMYFSQDSCTVPECSIQLVVFVEESEKENEQVKPLLELLDELLHEEVKFIDKYSFEGLREYSANLYKQGEPPDTPEVHVWNNVHLSLERLHVGQAFRLLRNEIFETRQRIQEQFQLALKNLDEKCPYYNQNDLNSTARQIIDDDAVWNKLGGIYDEIKAYKANVTTQVFRLVGAADASEINGTQYQFEGYFFEFHAKAVMDLMIGAFAKLEELNLTSTALPATQLLIVYAPSPQGPVPRQVQVEHKFLKTTFSECNNAIQAFVQYTYHVVSSVRRSVSEFARLIGFNDISQGPVGKKGVWDDALHVLPEYYLDAVKDLSESENAKLYAVQQEARNNVPRLQLKKDFQISWLIPNRGAHYQYYGGSTPFPPCHFTVNTIVFERPIKMSRSQIQALTRIPTSKNRDEDLTNTRPPFHDIDQLTREHRILPLTVKYDLKNHQWLGEGDEFHENSLEVAKRRKARGGTSKTHFEVWLILLTVTLVYEFL